MSDKNSVGITVKKADDHSEWYTQVIQKAELIEYTDVSGCTIFRPRSYAIWEKVQDYMNSKLKPTGVKNAYFPSLIPKKLLVKEEEHVEGFAAEVAWVTKGGSSPLNEELAIRPTSETIIYDAYSKWIRSHRDLPLLLNQWCNIVRWEFKHPMPFIRGREFLWQEGHSAFATKAEADAEVLERLELYADVMENMFAVPVIRGKKSKEETFAGADYTTSIETFMPVEKGIQVATSHCLGQNFSKAFDISYLDENQEKVHPYQTSWGLTTRTIGIMILVHGDDKGLVLPPAVADEKVVIVPILFDKTRDETLAACSAVYEDLKKSFSVILDDREEYSSGWKYNEWEMKGVPLRMEIGPKDVEKKQVVLVRRDTGEKLFVPMEGLSVKVSEVLDTMQKDMLAKARASMESRLVVCDNMQKAQKAVGKGKFCLVPWCGEGEDKFKEAFGGKSFNIPFDQSGFTPGMKCIVTGKDATCVAYVGRSY